MEARKARIWQRQRKGKNLVVITLYGLSVQRKLFHYFLHSVPLVSAACIQTSQNVTPKQAKRI